ncbi:MAG: PEP-CTERM sorting domain-containing protein [Phycisphaerales bacterium]|nr:MAG: PEP-CTERM sorting domain-containing protein [Phycisphaerales bacterium]
MTGTKAASRLVRRFRYSVIVFVALAVLTLQGSTVLAAAVDFESVAVGTLWGESGGQHPGELVLVQNDISVYVEEFFFGGTAAFFEAETGGRYASFFDSTPLELNHISVLFDFANVGVEVNQVTFDYLYLGGVTNFAVNERITFMLDSMEAIETHTAPGIAATVDDRFVTLTGNIDSFRIGGQELYIDNVTVIPEPATLLLLGVGGFWLMRRRVRTSV